MPRQIELGFTPYNADQAKYYISAANTNRPLNSFIGNERARKILSRAVFDALQRVNHSLGEFSFAIIGGPGSGKTTLARLLAKDVALPFVEIQPQQIKSTNDILVRIAQVCEETNSPNGSLELQEVRKNHFILPAMVVFIDEVHLLRNGVVQGLLKATEPKDRTLVTDLGWTADCRDVCWIIATTERGLLFDAFDTRFMKVPLLPYTEKEIATIVHKNHPKLPIAICEKIARFGGRNARESLTLAKDVELEAAMNSGNLDHAVDTVREEHGIDKWGMSYQRLTILQALQAGPISKQRLCFVANCKLEELEKYVMPPIETTTPDYDAAVTVGSRGYELTDAGIEELRKRGLLKE